MKMMCQLINCLWPCIFSLRLYDEVPPSNFDTAAYAPLMSVLLHRSVCSALPLGRSIKQLMMTSKTKGYIRFYKSFVPNTFFLKRDLIFSVFCCIWQVVFDNFLVMVMFSPYSAALHMGYNWHMSPVFHHTNRMGSPCGNTGNGQN